MNKFKELILIVGALATPASALAALAALSDEELVLVDGRDGFTMILSADEIGSSSTQLSICPDDTACGAYSGSDGSRVMLDGFRLQKIGVGGVNPGVGQFSVTSTLDVGGSSLTTDTMLALSTSWDRLRATSSAGYIGNISNSIGAIALDSSGSFQLNAVNSFFNNSSTEGKLYLELTDADLFMRQGAAGVAPEVVFSDLDFLWDMPEGIVGIDSQGLRIRGDTDFKLTFNVLHDEVPATGFVIEGYADGEDEPIFFYGWEGTLLDAELRLGGGGGWLGGTAVTGTAPNQLYDRSQGNQGLRMSMAWDYDPNFVWTAGEVDTDGLPNEPVLRFGQWTRLPNTAQPVSQPALTTRSFDFPLIAIDVLRQNRGPGGLCWGANWEGPATSCEANVHGGQFLNVAPGETHQLAILVRDGFLRAYSSDVRLIDPPNADLQYPWALIYTLGNIDANIYISPDQRTPSSVGVKADLLFMSQTFDVFDGDGDGNTWEQGANWGYGTHLMIGETDIQNAIGLVNSSFLAAADNLYIGLAGNGINIGDVSETNSPVRLALYGRFGGGDLPDLLQQVNIADVKLNLEMDRFNLTLSAPDFGEYYAGYELTARLANTNIANFSENTAGTSADDGSFLSFGEINRPATDARLANATGWIGARNGRLQLKSDFDTPANVGPQLVIQNDLILGASVSGVNTDVFQIGRVEFGNRNLGSIVIPSGQWYSALTLQEQ
jgi:hypothetical protein